MSEVIAVPTFERLFREAASLDIDKSDIRRLGDFLNDVLFRMVARAEGIAKANGRDIIEPWDLPIGAGLQERMHEFRKMDVAVDLRPILDGLAARPPMDLDLSEQTQGALPELFGGMIVALARTMKEIDPEVELPSSEHWERSGRVFALLL